MKVMPFDHNNYRKFKITILMKINKDKNPMLSEFYYCYNSSIHFYFSTVLLGNESNLIIFCTSKLHLLN